MFHLHARDGEGNPTWGREAYRACVEAVRMAVPGAVVVVSTSGRHTRDIKQRAAAVEARADMASLTLGSVDFRQLTSENSRATVAALLRAMRAEGVRPECAAFDLGHVHRLRELLGGGEMERPAWCSLILGVCLPADSRTLALLVDRLPNGTVWAAGGIGRAQWEANRWALALGGHVRVGLEDNLWMEAGIPATNARQVERIVRAARTLGREPATFARARAALGLA